MPPPPQSAPPRGVNRAPPPRVLPPGAPPPRAVPASTPPTKGCLVLLIFVVLSNDWIPPYPPLTFRWHLFFLRCGVLFYNLVNREGKKIHKLESVIHFREFMSAFSYLRSSPFPSTKHTEDWSLSTTANTDAISGNGWFWAAWRQFGDPHTLFSRRKKPFFLPPPPPHLFLFSP